jgi:hypothetical protein
VSWGGDACRGGAPRGEMHLGEGGTSARSSSLAAGDGDVRVSGRASHRSGVARQRGASRQGGARRGRARIGEAAATTTDEERREEARGENG